MKQQMRKALLVIALSSLSACNESPYDQMRSAWQEREREAASDAAALDEGRLVPNGGLTAAMTVPRLDRFIFELQAGTYRVGQVVQLTNLYLTGHPHRCSHFYFLSDVLPETKSHVYLGDCTEAAIIARTSFARAVVEATPMMGAGMEPGYHRIYRVPELVGVVQPLPGEPEHKTLVVTRIAVEDKVVYDPGWG